MAAATSVVDCVDTDGDGIGDAWEWQHFGNLGSAGAGTDFDGDSQTDRGEYFANTDPKDAADRMVVTGGFDAGDTTQVTLQFTTRPGRVYRIEQSSTLEIWSDSGATGAGSTRRWISSIHGPVALTTIDAVTVATPSAPSSVTS